MSATRVQICGRIAIRLAGRQGAIGPAGRQGRLAFTYLTLNRARTVARDDLVLAIWGEDPPPRAAASLRVILSRLRSQLGEEILPRHGALRLVLPPDAWVDIDVAGAKIHEAEAAVHAGDWSRAVAAAAVAYAISGRGLLPGEDAAWISEYRRWLEELHLRALECDARASLGIGGSELAAAERDARRLIRLAPYREVGHRLLMEVLDRRGDGAEALLVYEGLRSLLHDDLGAVPSPATQAVHRALLR